MEKWKPIKRTKEQIENDRYYRAEIKKEKEAAVALRKCIRRETKLLKFMFKTDVLYHHHGQKDSLKSKVAEQLEKMKTTGQYRVYHPYVWNYYGEGNNMMSRSLLEDYLWSHKEFATIYDVPLDGSYRFCAFDSGARGLGTFDVMTCEKVEKEIVVPKVSPGSCPPITWGQES